MVEKFLWYRKEKMKNSWLHLRLISKKKKIQVFRLLLSFEGVLKILMVFVFSQKMQENCFVKYDNNLFKITAFIYLLSIACFDSSMLCGC